MRTVVQIVLANPIKLGLIENVSIVRATEHRLTADADRRFFTIDDREYPMCHALSIEYAPADLFICPECKQEFADAGGLGGHRLHKHGIKAKAKP